MNNMKRKGFTLIELLITLTLMTIFWVLISQWVQFIVISQNEYKEYRTIISEFWAALWRANKIIFENWTELNPTLWTKNSSWTVLNFVFEDNSWIPHTYFMLLEDSCDNYLNEGYRLMLTDWLWNDIPLMDCIYVWDDTIIEQEVTSIDSSLDNKIISYNILVTDEWFTQSLKWTLFVK